MSFDIAELARLPASLRARVRGILQYFTGIRSIWSMDHDAGASWPSAATDHELLAFGGPRALASLRASRSEAMDAGLLLAVDGEIFGPQAAHPVCTLARWTWRQTSPREAFYSRPHWLDRPGGEVIRVPTKALLAWQMTRG